MTFAWLRLAVLLAIHEAQLAEHGGRPGIRDIALLESALARPQQRFAYEEPPPDAIDLGATYAIALLQNHPFIDGNKRTAFVALETFLRLKLASDTSTETDFIAFVRSHAIRRASL